MGSSTSKAAKAAAGGAAKRQYPTHVPTLHATTSKGPSPPPPPAQSSTEPTLHSKPEASDVRIEARYSEAYDPHLAASLRAIGPVSPVPTHSQSTAALSGQSATRHPKSPPSSFSSAPTFPSSLTAQNPALRVLSARRELAEQADSEFAQLGRTGFEGKEFLDVMLVRQALMMRDQKGMGEEEIEGRLELKKGTVKRLGRRGVVAEIGGHGREEGGALG